MVPSTPRGRTSETLTFEFELPPSTNALYQKRRGGQVALTEVAKTYRETVKRAIADRISEVQHFPVSLEHIYMVEMVCYIDKLQNPGWFRKLAKDRPEKLRTDKKTGKKVVAQKAKLAGERDAETRYKRLDVDNRIKFLQDCFIKSLGINGDEQVFKNTLEKIERRGTDTARVTISVLDPNSYLESEEAVCRP